MKTSHKTIYYASTFIICICACVLSLLNIKSYNKYPSPSAVKNSLSLYVKNYYNIKPSADIKKYFPNKIFPFPIIFKNDSNNEFNFNYKNNELIFTNYHVLSKESKSFLNSTFSLFSLPTNITEKYNASLINTIDQIRIYHYLNIYFIIKPKEDLQIYKKYLNIFQNYSHKYKLQNYNTTINVKFIYYENKERLIEGKEEIIYDELKRLNPPSFFYEIQDKSKMNIFLINSVKENIPYKYNKDINSMIYPINFEKQLNEKYLNQIIAVNYLQQFFNLKHLKKDLFNNSILNQFINFFKDEKTIFHFQSLITLKNIDKISKIFPFYETIKTYTQAKSKLNEIHQILKLFITQQKFGVNRELLNKLYINTIFLLESSELVTFDLYFSFEFKIGQFLPIMMPIIYGMIKITKSHFK